MMIHNWERSDLLCQEEMEQDPWDKDLRAADARSAAAVVACLPRQAMFVSARRVVRQPLTRGVYPVIPKSVLNAVR